jgi:hypothetical protein
MVIHVAVVKIMYLVVEVLLVKITYVVIGPKRVINL